MIVETWIVDIEHQTVAVFRDPDPKARSYRGSFTPKSPDTLRPLELPGAEVDLSLLFNR